MWHAYDKRVIEMRSLEHGVQLWPVLARFGPDECHAEALQHTHGRTVRFVRARAHLGEPEIAERDGDNRSRHLGGETAANVSWADPVDESEHGWFVEGTEPCEPNEDVRRLAEVRGVKAERSGIESLTTGAHLVLDPLAIDERVVQRIPAHVRIAEQREQRIDMASANGVRTISGVSVLVMTQLGEPARCQFSNGEAWQPAN